MEVEAKCRRCELSRDAKLEGQYAVLCRPCYLLVIDRPSRETFERYKAWVDGPPSPTDHTARCEGDPNSAARVEWVITDPATRGPKPSEECTRPPRCEVEVPGEAHRTLSCWECLPEVLPLLVPRSGKGAALVRALERTVVERVDFGKRPEGRN